MSIAKRDDHLKQFFPADIIKQLDNAERNVLYEEFAISEQKRLAGLDIKLIKAQLGTYLQDEYQRRLKHIQPEEYELLKPWYLEVCHTVDEIICSKCGVLLGLEVDTIDDNINPYHHEGKFVVPIGSNLMAYRPRLDGQMGYQCGNVLEKYKKDWEKYEVDLEEWNTKLKEAQDKYTEEMNAYSDLSPKKQKSKKPPVYDSESVPAEPTPPAGPAYEECGNDTRWSQIEIDNVPESHVMTSVTKDDRIKVKQEMDATNYAPDVKETKRGKKVESFELRKVK